MTLQQCVLVAITVNLLLQQLIFAVSGKGLSGVNLKLATYHSPPYDVLIRQPDGNYTVEGSTVKIWDWCSIKLKFSITYVPVVDEALLAKFGAFEAAISKVINKEVDGISSALTVTPDRKQKMDFTFVIWTEPYTLIVPKPQEESRLFAFIRPFQPMVWFSFAITVTIFIAIMSWFSWFYKNYLNGLEKRENVEISNARPNSRHHELENMMDSFSYYGIYVANIITNHGIYTPFAQHSFRILAGVLLLAALVLVNSYSSIVVSSLTVPVMEPAVNSFEDLASSKRVFLLLRKDVILGQLILNAKTGVFKILGDEIRQNPDRLFLNHPDLYRRLENGPYAYPYLASSNRDYMGTQFKKDGFCRHQLSDPLQISSGFFCMLLAKDFKYTQQISDEFMKLWETGLTRFWVEHLTRHGGDQCIIKNEKPTTSAVAIKKADLISAFLILGIGAGLSLLSFLTELIIGNFKNSFNSSSYRTKISKETP